MSSWSLLDLGASVWTPRNTLPTSHAWPESARLTRIGDLASVRTLSSDVHGPKPLVTPSTVGADGRLRPRKSSEDGATLGDGLKEGDVLVPVHGDGPGVLVTRELSDLAFRGFLVVRAIVPDHALWVWAILSSATGVAACQQAASGSPMPALTYTALANLAIPAPDRDDMLRDYVPSPLVQETTGAENRSRWDTRDLRSQTAWTTRSEPQGGVDLVELSSIASIWRGSVGRDAYYSVAATGRVRVLTPRQIRGSQDDGPWWAEASRTTTESTVVIMPNYPYQTLVPGPGFALMNELFALDITPAALADSEQSTRSSQATSLASYLMSPDGEQALRAQSTGIAVPRLNATSLARVRLPMTALSHSIDVEAPLAERLDSVVRKVIAR